MVDMPHFMENAEWFYFDVEIGKFVLTDKAPEKAKQSYDEYYKDLSNGN